MEISILESPNKGKIPIESHRRLLSYTIGSDDIELPFTLRLAQENGWSLTYSKRVFEEYKRFCYMCMHSKIACTPSLDVDQAWHLHLTYSHDYWKRFCPELLGKPLHHGPTLGGNEEDIKFLDQYNETLEFYQLVFGVNPPIDIWPGAEIRFSKNLRLRWVDLSRVYAIEKRKLYWIIPVMTSLTAIITAIGIKFLEL